MTRDDTMVVMDEMRIGDAGSRRGWPPLEVQGKDAGRGTRYEGPSPST